MKFEQIVRNMSAKEIIMAMVESLKHPPIVNIDMETYGKTETIKKYYFFGLLSKTKKVCYGCAATNTICQISNVKFTSININNFNERADFINCDLDFLKSFEISINFLRKGFVISYNRYASLIDIALIKENSVNLPFLGDFYTDEDLKPYIELANKQ